MAELVRTTAFDDAYTLAETLGRGRFSQVRRCTPVGGGPSRATKIMDLDDPELGASPADAEREVLAEVDVLRRVDHPGVVQLVEAYKNRSRYFLVLEDLSGGDLFDRIEQNGPFGEEDAAPVVRQVAGAVGYLHGQGIVHRDIKPDNLVFDAKGKAGSIKLIDFGYAGFCADGAQLRGLCGTPDYAAPEILTWYQGDAGKGKAKGQPYGRLVDMWSLGVVIYILLCGFPPFYGDDDEQMFALIRAGSYAFPDAIDGYRTTWPTVSEAAKALVRSLLTVAPDQRASADDVLRGEWLAACTPRSGGWVGKMRERSASGWRAGGGGGAAARRRRRYGAGHAAGGPRPDRSRRDAAPADAAKIKVDAKMVIGDDGYEGKLKYSVGQAGLVSQFSRWIVDRLVKREMRILMLGLDNSGKTSILYRLKLGQPKRTVPTIGFNVETLEYKSIAFTVWDVGGQEKLRALWRHYFQTTQAVIFVVDSSDRARLPRGGRRAPRPHPRRGPAATPSSSSLPTSRTSPAHATPRRLQRSSGSTRRTSPRAATSSRAAQPRATAYTRASTG